MSGVANWMTDIDRLTEELCYYSVLAYNRILVSSAGGNNSARIGDSEEFLITASGLSLGDTKPENLITINAKAEKIAGPEGFKPSKESRMHVAIYTQRPDVKAIFHLHPRYSGFAPPAHRVRGLPVRIRHRPPPTPVTGALRARPRQ